MDARTMMRRYASPERSRPWAEPLKLLTGMKIPVVYYLCRNHHLEHPHFMEVPLSSSDGLYLRDVMDRLNALRGRGMATMYSWSCKRSYKNGFVWHDLLEDDLVVPVHGNEYVLKGSELLDRSPVVNNGGGSTRDAQLVEPSPSPPSSSSSPPAVVIKEAKSPPSEVKLGVCKPTGAQDAATQTDNGDSVSLKPKRCSEIEEEVSPPPPSSSSSGGKTGTLESLIRAEARMNGFRLLEDDQVLVSARTRLKATNVFMHLITCGSISVKDHHNFGLVQSYKPGFSRPKFASPEQLDCFSDNPKLMALRLEDKEYFSGSLVETKRRTERAGDGVPTLKRSSSYNADRSCKSLDTRKENDKVVDSSRSNCLPRTIKVTSSKQSRNETMRSPISNATVVSSAVLDCRKASSNCSSRGGSKRITDYASSLKGSSSRFESFREDKEKVIVIEERLTSGARVIIQSTVPCDISEGSLDSD